jgi:hypothetical protein
MSFPMVFSFSLFLLFFSCGHHLTESQAGADGAFVREKQEQNRKVQKNRGKITIRLHSRGKITNSPGLTPPGPRYLCPSVLVLGRHRAQSRRSSSATTWTSTGLRCQVRSAGDGEHGGAAPASSAGDGHVLG